MEFTIEKAKSRVSELEYITFDLKAVRDFLADTKSPVVEMYDKETEKHFFSYPISPKMNLVLTNYRDKKSDRMSQFSVGITYVAYQDLFDKDMYHMSSMLFDPRMDRLLGTNCTELNVGRKEKGNHAFYIAVEGDFSAQGFKSPFFLEEHEFNYVFEKTS